MLFQATTITVKLYDSEFELKFLDEHEILK